MVRLTENGAPDGEMVRLTEKPEKYFYNIMKKPLTNPFLKHILKTVEQLFNRYQIIAGGNRSERRFCRGLRMRAYA